MDSLQDVYSTMLSEDVSRLKDQDIRLTVRPKVEPVSDNEVESSLSKLKSPYMCTICNKSFLRKGNLKQHLIIHSEKRPFVCDICQKAFSRKTVLNRHKLSHLKIPSQHKCDSCGEAFSRKSDLLKHKKTHKSSKQDKCSEMKPALYDQGTHVSDIETPPLKKKSFECRICHKTFMQRTDLKRHSITHSKTATAYKCDQCGKDYFSQFLLKIHTLIAHQTPHLKKKSFECEICHKTFMQRTYLKRHSITHSKTTTSYKCEQCGKEYLTRFSLKIHMKSHKKTLTLYNCDKCSNSFSSKSILTKHKKIHSKKYKCNHCNITFYLDFEFIHHLIKMHK